MSTMISIIAIIVLLFIRSQALLWGFSGIFNIVTLLMVALIIVSLIRTWIRG